jgi:hypothetical protein
MKYIFLCHTPIFVYEPFLKQKKKSICTPSKMGIKEEQHGTSDSLSIYRGVLTQMRDRATVKPLSSQGNTEKDGQTSFPRAAFQNATHYVDGTIPWDHRD